MIVEASKRMSSQKSDPRRRPRLCCQSGTSQRTHTSLHSIEEEKPKEHTRRMLTYISGVSIGVDLRLQRNGKTFMWERRQPLGHPICVLCFCRERGKFVFVWKGRALYGKRDSQNLQIKPFPNDRMFARTTLSNFCIQFKVPSFVCLLFTI